jgi:hypothetical protein
VYVGGIVFVSRARCGVVEGGRNGEGSGERVRSWCEGGECEGSMSPMAKEREDATTMAQLKKATQSSARHAAGVCLDDLARGEVGGEEGDTEGKRRGREYINTVFSARC